MSTESIHARLDREAKRMRDDLVGGVNTHISESFINGVQHAATIAYRMETVVTAEGRIAVRDTPEPDSDREATPADLPIRDWWIDIDGHGEPTVWMPGARASVPVITQSAAGPVLWAVLAALVPERIVEAAKDMAVETVEVSRK